MYPDIFFIMASVKFIVGSCSAVVIGYFTYRELQFDTLDFTLNKHIPAKRPDVYTKFFHEPEFWLKIHPNCTGVTNIIRSQDEDGRRIVRFDMHEKVRILGFSSSFQIQLTVKEIQENVATHMSGSQLKGWFEFDQGFHLTDSKEGGTMLQDHCQYTAPRFLARYIRGVGLAQHTAITENTRKYFMEESKETQTQST